MELKISYEIAKTRYPEQVAEIMEKLAKSTSKEKGAKPDDLKWKFNWAVACGSSSFNDLIARKPKVELSINTKLKNYAGNCHVCLNGSKGHWYGSSSQIETPVEIIEQHKVFLEKEEIEQERFNAPADELGKILAQLHRDPGFFAIRI